MKSHIGQQIRWKKERKKSVRWAVYGINELEYQVSDGLYNRRVNLRTNECDCRKWQLSGIPCGHVIAVSRFLGQTDWLKYVQDCFKKVKYQATYAESIQFVGNYKEWEYPDHIHPVIPPYMDNPQPGRPKNTNRILSQGEEPKARHCSRCGEVGHSRLRCNKSFVPDPPVRKGKKNKIFQWMSNHMVNTRTLPKTLVKTHTLGNHKTHTTQTIMTNHLIIPSTRLKITTTTHTHLNSMIKTQMLHKHMINIKHNHHSTCLNQTKHKPFKTIINLRLIYINSTILSNTILNI